MKKIITHIKNRKVFLLSGMTLLLLLSFLAGAMASNMGFKLNHGIVTAINRLLNGSGVSVEQVMTDDANKPMTSVNFDTSSSNIGSVVIALGDTKWKEWFSMISFPQSGGITLELLSSNPFPFTVNNIDGGTWIFSGGGVTFDKREVTGGGGIGGILTYSGGYITYAEAATSDKFVIGPNGLTIYKSDGSTWNYSNGQMAYTLGASKELQ